MIARSVLPPTFLSTLPPLTHPPITCPIQATHHYEATRLLHCLSSLPLCPLQDALALYQRRVQAELWKSGGYLLEAADGLCLVAFTGPAVALR